MRKLILSILLYIIGVNAFSQINFVDTNKYKVMLPSFWKKDKGLLKLFDTTLYKTWYELQNKRICTKSCDPFFLVILVISKPEYLDPYVSFNERPEIDQVSDYKGTGNNAHFIIIPYKFSAKLVLKNQEGKILSEKIIVDTTEVFKKFQYERVTSKSTKYPVSIDPPYTGSDPGKREESRVAREKQMKESAQTNSFTNEKIFDPVEYKKNHRYDHDPVLLYTIIDKRIRQI
jgi:hypothetical protein